ncbi:hypothetical protein BDM02DRAFT_1541884 [Thelephora ganbajun]|uniref:Uncharacterized protein n=1 Tax=Thelephora ganbajun TaxID=370292 RepID=A0ACB6Z2C6_THEGA|nr:hypothetical protein BDM02DRAFT_1541884 [Thelephora ganbajun]
MAISSALGHPRAFITVSTWPELRDMELVKTFTLIINPISIALLWILLMLAPITLSKTRPEIDFSHALRQARKIRVNSRYVHVPLGKEINREHCATRAESDV